MDNQENQNIPTPQQPVSQPAQEPVVNVPSSVAPVTTQSGMPQPVLSPKSGGKKKWISILLFILILGIFGGLGFYLWNSGLLNSYLAPQTNSIVVPTVVPASPTPADLQSDQDLQNTLNEVDLSDPASLQTELDQNTTDASGFSQ